MTMRCTSTVPSIAAVRRGALLFGAAGLLISGAVAAILYLSAWSGEQQEKSSARQAAEARSRKAGVIWIYSQPAGVELTKTETTLGQYRQCVDAGACKEEHFMAFFEGQAARGCNFGLPNRDNHPMNCVDWYGAEAFCGWLDSAAGRLPTEGEWYAEASNRGTREWPWGDHPAVSGDYAVWGGYSVSDTLPRTRPVCSRPVGNSVSGLCDMCGNVREWVSSGEGSPKVLRGGAWNNNAVDHLRASSRFEYHGMNTSAGNGFRCARSRR
jgi:formylglycine-generating enzyme required for sulfatase activity